MSEVLALLSKRTFGEGIEKLGGTGRVRAVRRWYATGDDVEVVEATADMVLVRELDASKA